MPVLEVIVGEVGDKGLPSMLWSGDARAEKPPGLPDAMDGEPNTEPVV